jgi:hypothetical protein
MNERLKSHNGRVALAILVPTPGSNTLRARVLVQTEKVDSSKRKAVPAVMATYCPFCGQHEDAP